MAIISIHDDRPELQEGQYLFEVSGFWVVTDEYFEPSPLEVKIMKLAEVLDAKQVVTKVEMEAKPRPIVEVIEGPIPISEEPVKG